MVDSKSAFHAQGFSSELQYAYDEIRQLYGEDSVPWVIGYSGGKDSTAIVQLVWNAIAELDPSERTKPIHVISTDTLVENPVVSAWVRSSLDRLQKTSDEQRIPIQAHPLTPVVTETFWVNLIGRGYR